MKKPHKRGRQIHSRVALLGGSYRIREGVDESGPPTEVPHPTQVEVTKEGIKVRMNCCLVERDAI